MNYDIEIIFSIDLRMALHSNMHLSGGLHESETPLYRAGTVKALYETFMLTRYIKSNNEIKRTIPNICGMTYLT